MLVKDMINPIFYITKFKIKQNSKFSFLNLQSLFTYCQNSSAAVMGLWVELTSVKLLDMLAGEAYSVSNMDALKVAFPVALMRSLFPCNLSTQLGVFQSLLQVAQGSWPLVKDLKI